MPLIPFMKARSMDNSRKAARTGLRRLAAVALVAAWLGTTAWLFWKVETTGLQPAGSGAQASEGLAIFDAGSLDGSAALSVSASLGTASRATVVHLRDPACPCTGAADEHFEALVKRHGNDGVVFAVADAPGASPLPIRGLEQLSRLSTVDARRLWRDLPSAPAVAVFDADGRPVYLGPYADAARCGASRGGAADAALAAALDARGTPPIPLLAMGCFCKQAAGVGNSGLLQAALQETSNWKFR